MTALALPRLAEEFQRQLSRYPTGPAGRRACGTDRRGERRGRVGRAIGAWGSLDGGHNGRDLVCIERRLERNADGGRRRALYVDVDQPVARYWPAFGAEGKATITGHRTAIARQRTSLLGPLHRSGHGRELAGGMAARGRDSARDRRHLVPGARDDSLTTPSPSGWLSAWPGAGDDRPEPERRVEQLVAEPLGLNFHLGLPAGEARGSNPACRPSPWAPDPDDPHPDMSSRRAAAWPQRP